MKNLIMIAYHFPPVRVSSGIQRTLKFTQYLLGHGWIARVLTVNPIAYEQVSDGQMQEIPAEVTVSRAFALDTSKHLAIKGRYISWMALPDRWVSWCVGGVFSGLSLVLKYKPKVIFSTYPIATAHLIGLILHRLTGIPWVADFRDSMTEDDYPTNPRQRKVYQWIERQTVKYSTYSIFTTPGAIRMYAARYPEIPSTRWVLIPNGFDEENFVQAEQSVAYKNALNSKVSGQIVLLHSGILYPSERDPTQFFEALAEMLRAGLIMPSTFKVLLRSTGHDDLHIKLIELNGLQDIVFLKPGVSYVEALAEMLVVDGLLIFQAANCNHQIPAKIYEYLRARRPIFALTDPDGDTASVLIDAKVPYIAPLNDKQNIVKNLSIFLNDVIKKKAVVADAEFVKMHSREARSKLLADLIDIF